METEETPSLGPSCCSGCLFLSFALCLVNLHEVPLPKYEGDSNGSQILFVFLHQFLSLSRLLHSLLRLSLSSLTSSTSLHSHGPCMRRTKRSLNLNSLSIVFCCFHSPYLMYFSLMYTVWLQIFVVENFCIKPFIFKN